MYNLGLIGKNISHSFSKEYFEKKFKENNITNFSYSLFPLKTLNQINHFIKNKKIVGLNVTSPYKEDIIKHLDKLGPIASITKSVNTIFITPKDKKIGFNTDLFGFKSILEKLNIKNEKALILGSGGVSKTISYCLDLENIKHLIVSRYPKNKMQHYSDIKNVINDYKLIINTTPLGQFPKINNAPNIPYDLITNKHYCIDLIYNPSKTLFLKKAKTKGAQIINGKEMLIKQAEKSWALWLKLMTKYNV